MTWPQCFWICSFGGLGTKKQKRLAVSLRKWRRIANKFSRKPGAGGGNATRRHCCLSLGTGALVVNQREPDGWSEPPRVGLGAVFTMIGCAHSLHCEASPLSG